MTGDNNVDNLRHDEGMNIDSDDVRGEDGPGLLHNEGFKALDSALAWMKYMNNVMFFN